MIHFLTSIFNKNKLVLFIDHEKIKVEIFKDKEKISSADINERDLDQGALTDILAAHKFSSLALFFHTFQCQYTHIPTQSIPFWHRLWIPFNLWRYYGRTVFGLKKQARLVCGVHPQFNGFHQKILNLIRGASQSSVSCRHWIMDSVAYISPIPEPWIIIPLVTPTGGHILVVLKEGLPIFSRVYNPDLLDKELAATAHYLKRYDFKNTQHAHLRRYDSPPLETLRKSMTLSIPALWKKQILQGLCQCLTLLIGGISIFTFLLAFLLGARGAWAAFKTQDFVQRTPAIDYSYLEKDQLLLNSYNHHLTKTFSYMPVLLIFKSQLPKTMVITNIEWSKGDMLINMAVDPRVDDKNKLVQSVISTVGSKLPQKMTVSAQNVEDGVIFKLSQ